MMQQNLRGGITVNVKFAYKLALTSLCSMLVANYTSAKIRLALFSYTLFHINAEEVDNIMQLSKFSLPQLVSYLNLGYFFGTHKNEC